MGVRWRIRLLGGLTIEREGQVITRFETRQAAALFAYLAYHPHRAHLRETLLELLWPEEDPAATRVRLRTVLVGLRHLLESVPPEGESEALQTILITDRASVQLEPRAIATDVSLFDATLRRAAEAAPGDRAHLLAEAVALYQGELLPGYYEEWIGPERARLADAHLVALAELATHRAGAGDLVAAIGLARRAVTADPLREGCHAQLMRLYLQAGRRADALRQYRELERLLREELRATPSPPLRALLEEIGPDRGQQGEDVARGPGHVAVPPPAAGPADRTLLPPPPGGAVPLGSPFYVERDTDAAFRQAIERGDSIVLVKGPRQVGKTSLLARGLQAARERGARVALTDFQKLHAAQLESADSFCLALAEMIADQLGLEGNVRADWDAERGWSVNLERFLRRRALGSPDPTPSEPRRLVWGLDEVDRLFAYPYASEVFGLFRAWHNERALLPDTPWSRLTLAIAYATEAHLFITDLNQSPFNVGTRLELRDLTQEQVADLNRRYGSHSPGGLPPLASEAEVDRFFQLVGGHPYLVQCGLHRMVSDRLDLAAIEAQATHDRGPFGEHLRRLWHSLSQSPELCAALREALERGACPTEASFYRLQSAGVLLGDSVDEVRPRCPLYRRYLQAHLP